MESGRPAAVRAIGLAHPCARPKWYCKRPGGPQRTTRADRGGLLLIGVGADDFPEAPRSQGAINRQVDRVLEETDRAVAEGEVGAARVPAPEAELAEVLAGVDPSRGEPILGITQRT